MAAKAEPATRPRPGREFWLRWTAYTTVGEFAGFSAPALTGAVVFALGFPDAAMIPPLVLAGVVEGSVLGFAQAVAMGPYVPGLARPDWVRASALGAAVAWTLGMTQGTLWDDLESVGAAALIPVAVLLSAVLLLSLPVAQWVVLRRHVAGAGWWIPANIAAWAAGMVWVFAAMSLVGEDDPAGRAAAIGAASGGLMGLTAAAVTGGVLVRLLGKNRETIET